MEKTSRNIMNWIEKVSFLSTIILFTLTVFLLNRFSQEAYCNQNPAISQIHLFNQGRLVKVPNCSFIDFSRHPSWTESEQKLIANTQKIPPLSSPILLTIDLEHKNKFRVIHNYYWVGSDFLFSLEKPFILWLLKNNYTNFQGIGEARWLNEILNSLSLELLENQPGFYNWSLKNEIGKVHLSNLLMSQREYCDHYMIFLQDSEDCNKLSEVSDVAWSHQPLTLLISKVLFTYIKQLELDEQLTIIKALKASRSQTDFSHVQFNFSLVKDFSALVLYITHISSQIIKSLNPFNIINNQVLSNVVNRLTLFSESDYLVLNGKSSQTVSGVMRHKFLLANHQGQLLTAWGRVLPLKLGELVFENLLVSSEKLNIQDPIYKHSRFVYLISSDLLYEDIDRLGVVGFLLSNNKISFAKIHIPSLNTAKVQKVALKSIKDLSRSLGWEKVNWSKQKYSYQPKAQIDGVISFR